MSALHHKLVSLLILIHFSVVAFKMAITSFGLSLLMTALPDTIIFAPAYENQNLEKLFIVVDSRLQQMKMIKFAKVVIINNSYYCTVYLGC